MIKRRILASTAILLVLPVQVKAGHFEPVIALQLPALAGPCSLSAGSGTISCATLLGQTNTWSALQTFTTGISSSGTAVFNGVANFNAGTNSSSYSAFGSEGQFLANDRTGSGYGIFYRTGGVNYLYDSVLGGNALSWNGVGAVKTIKNLLDDGAGNSSFAGMLTQPLLQTLNLTYAGAGQACGSAILNVAAVGAGNAIAFDPTLSCVASVSGDPAAHQRTSALFSATSQTDAAAEEQTLAVHTIISKGFKKPLAANTAYSIGDNVTMGGADYRATTAGTTASPSVLASNASYGSRPSSSPFTVQDGGVTWLWINDSAIDGKLGAYIETDVQKGNGAAWGLTTNYHTEAGAYQGFAVAQEWDYDNNTGDCTIGTTNCYGAFMQMQGYRSTAGINMVGGNANNFGVHWALWFNGATLASDAAIKDDTAGTNGYIATGTHADATFRDDSTSKYAFESTNNKQTADIFLPSGSPLALNIGGSHNISIQDTSTSSAGIDIHAATYSVAQVVGKNWGVTPAGGLNAASFSVGGTAGVSCTGTPSASYAVTLGIVTHC